MAYRAEHRPEDPRARPPRPVHPPLGLDRGRQGHPRGDQRREGGTPAQFSRQQTQDLETSISIAVTRALDQTYPPVGGARAQGGLKFLKLYKDGPQYEDDGALVPSAVILPTGPIKYGPSHLTPTLAEDTWEPRGKLGLGLYVLSEASREFQVTFRGQTQAERNALKAAIETAFTDPAVEQAQACAGLPRPGLFVGGRYGVLMAMPEYWGLTARLTLLDSEKLDDADSMAKNIHEGRFSLRAEANHVKLGPVSPFALRLRDISP